jgi:hypothetical protein
VSNVSLQKVFSAEKPTQQKGLLSSKTYPAERPTQQQDLLSSKTTPQKDL